MRVTSSIGLCAFVYHLLYGLLSSAQAQTQPPPSAVTLRTRLGLGNVIPKLLAGNSVKVAYFGGSITEGFAASPQATSCYRALTTAWLKSTYPTATITEINGATPGMPSDIGVFRFQTDVLQYNPDLVFLEFAVNDKSIQEASIFAAYEGIVRQIWKANPNTDICFLYAYEPDVQTPLMSGVMAPIQAIQERVAYYYGIPAINLALPVAQQIANGTLLLQPMAGDPRPVFSTDTIHPTNYGHALYASTIQSAWTTMAGSSTAGPHALRMPLSTANREAAKLVPITPAMLTAGWAQLPVTDPVVVANQRRDPVIWMANQAGEKLKFRFYGTSVRLRDFTAPDGAQLLVTVDGVVKNPISLENSGAIGLRVDPLSSLPNAIHSVEIQIANPATAGHTVWRIASLMIVGDLVPDTQTGYWPLNETGGTTALDLSGNNRNGTLSGNPTVGAGSLRDKAWDFEQDDATPNSDYIDCGTVPGSAAALTVMFWMKPDQADRNMIPVSKFAADSSGPNMTKGWAIRLRDDGDIKFRVGGEYANTEISAGAGTYGTNWTHIAATFASGTAKLYVNGVLKATATGITTRSVDNGTTPLRFAKNAAGTVETYDGLLDDVQIYSAALDQNQIQGLMGGSGLSQVANWHIDEDWGTATADATSKQNHATIFGSPSWLYGKQGYSVDLNGSSQYISAPNSTSLNLANKLTLMAWAKADTLTGTRAVVSKNNTAYELNIRDGHLRLELKLSDGSLMRAETTNVEINTGSYYHVAAVRDGVSVRLYINGVSKPVTLLDTARTLNLATNTGAVRIGGNPDGTEWFDGIIDEVEIYDVPLSMGDVGYAMNS